MAWNPPADALLADGKAGRPSHARAVRDLTAALAERAGGSPWLNGVGAVEHIVGFGFALPPFSDELVLVGEWVVPDEVERIDVTVIGAGGQGGSWDDSVAIFRGGGGGGGGAMWREVLAVITGQVFAVSVGAAGERFNRDGRPTTFGDLRAAGGTRGEHGIDPLFGEGGEGGGPYTEQISDPRFTHGSRGGASQQFLHFGEGPLISGRGAASPMGGGGGPGRAVNVVGGAAGDGYDAARVIAELGYIGPYGAGGGGAAPAPDDDFVTGGRGANGAVIVRY